MANIGDKKITHIYQGNNLILENNQETKDIKIGDKKVDFVFQGNELLYPNPIKDGMVLYYDFKGVKNSDVSKNVARDLSSNGNNGTLQNFSYTSESGYNNGLHFDGIDDYISVNTVLDKNFTISLTTKVGNNSNNYILSASSIYFFIRKSGYNLDLAILNNAGSQELYRAPNFFIEFGNTKLSLSYTVNSDEKKTRVYVNGILHTTFDMVEEAKPQMNLTGFGIWNNNYFFKGSLYNLKVYDKPLNNQEIEHNYNLEKERWSL